jgi:hypothetical protein
LIPECYWPSALPLQETTLILWSDLKTTLDRICARGDEAWSAEQHQKFIELFLIISDRYQLPLINTSHISTDELMVLISEHLGKRNQMRPAWLTFLPLDCRRAVSLSRRLQPHEQVDILVFFIKIAILSTNSFCIINPLSLAEDDVAYCVTKNILPLNMHQSLSYLWLQQPNRSSPATIVFHG